MSDREALANRQQPAAPSGIIGRLGAPVTIGMLRNRERPTFSALAAAHAAVMQGAKLIFFSAADVDIVAENIRGWTYEHGGWRRVSSRLPDVIINDQSSIRHREIWDALQARVPFTSPLIGDKIEIMRRMEEGDFYRRLQIPTRRLTSFSVLLNMIERHGRIVVKPKEGSKGRDVFYVGKLDAAYSINADEAWRECDTDALQNFYAEKLYKSNFIAQRYIESVTKTGLPFDVRLDVRRNGRGEWQTVGVYPRIGSGRTITSNMSTGGSVADLRKFLSDRFGEQAGAIRRKLMKLASEMPPSFQKLYDDRQIDALGIDIGLDPSGRPWLFEVNDFPGADPFDLQAAILRVEYAIYLARQE